MEVRMITNSGATLKKLEEKYLKQDVPNFNVGDSVKMKIKVQEADKIRTHPFEGTIIRKTGRGLKATFTVRKVSFGEGVEKSFPIHSPVIESLSVTGKGIVKRSKLYYIRSGVGKKLRIQREQTQ